MVISSRKNQRVKEIASLKEKKNRESAGLYLVEGEKSVKEAFLHGADVQTVLGVEDLVAPYFNKCKELITVTKEIASYVSDAVTPQGIVATVKMSENRLIAPLSRSILLDGVQDPGNIGTIIRTATACGVKDIYMINCADPYSPKAVRSSMSGIFFVDIKRGSAEEILNCLKEVPIVLGDLDGENLFDFTPPNNFCIAIGSEAHGPSALVKNAAAHTVTIPMTDYMESLNAGVSASVMLYQFISKLK